MSAVAPIASAQPPSRRWLVSPAFDLAFLVGPALLAGLIALTVPEGAELSPWGWVLLVLCVDVAHVWASLWRTYLDPEERRRRPVLLTVVPLACGVGAMVVHGLSPALFWTVLAYLAVYHFIRQQVGIAVLYRMREGQPMGSMAAKVERWLIWGVTGFPLLWWHAHLPRRFDWFLPGDFLPGLPPWVLGPAALGVGGLALAHLGFRIREGRVAWGRDLWLLTTAVVWFGGIVLTDADLAFTLSNVVAHGVPYFALVAWTVLRKWQMTGRGPGRAAWFRGLGVLVFLAPLLALALAEEGLWDALVWRDNEWLFGAWGVDLAAVAWWAVPLLSLPQLTHYVLDGFIWKMGGQNPGLREWVVGGG